MKIGKLEFSPLALLLVFVPVSVLLEVFHAPGTWIFVTSAIAIIPLAGFMGTATEKLADTMGAGVGGFLNATFGNAAELIIAIVALYKGLYDVVKASITGSIIGNVLLVMGAALLSGGLRYHRQSFNRTAAGLGATLLALSTVGLVIPALYHFSISEGGDPAESHVQSLSLAIAIVLFVTYLLSLLFSLHTHQHLFAAKVGPDHPVERAGHWSRKKAALYLLVSTVGVAIESELLVGSVEHAAESFGFSDVFIGVVVVAIIGNAAEHSSAIMVAMKNRMDLSLNIAIGSSIQVALFIAPFLVFLSYTRAEPMDLLFTRFEVLAVGVSVGVLNMVAQDGESHWMEGVLLLAVYLILAIAFYFLP